MQSFHDRRPAPARRLPRRRTDRVEDAAAWLLMTAALFGLVLAAWVAVCAHAVAADQARSAQREGTQVEAVLLDDPPVRYREPDMVPPESRSVRFTDATGHEQVRDVPVAGEPPAGSMVRVWADSEGRVVPAPPSELDMGVVAAVAGFGTAASVVAVLAAAWTVLRRALEARNCAAWEREWARVEPLWSGRDHRR